MRHREKGDGPFRCMSYVMGIAVRRVDLVDLYIAWTAFSHLTVEIDMLVGEFIEESRTVDIAKERRIEIATALYGPLRDFGVCKVRDVWVRAWGRRQFRLMCIYWGRRDIKRWRELIFMCFNEWINAFRNSVSDEKSQP